VLGQGRCPDQAANMFLLRSNIPIRAIPSLRPY
jgi:hypothetical protein